MIKRHPYIITSLIATLLSVVVWFGIPKEYAAITKVSDEYKEIDLAIGLDKFQSKVREMMELANSGVNDVEVYCKWLKTENFARYIACVQVPDKGVTYGQWLMKGRFVSLFNDGDTISAVANQIEYNISTKNQTLTIQFSDRDPVVAAQMLDSVTLHLQALVMEARQKMTQALLKDAKRKYKVAEVEVAEAERKYVNYCDSHFGITREKERTEQTMLFDKLEKAKKQYQSAVEECARYEFLKSRYSCSFAVIKNNTVPIKPHSSFPILLIGVNLFALLFVKGVRLYKIRKKEGSFMKDLGNIFSPWLLTAVLWTIILICIYLMGDKLYPLTDQAYIGIGLWIFTFCIVSFVTYLLCGKESKESSHDEFHYNKTIFYILLVITLIMSPLCVKKVMDIVGMFDTKDLMANIRLFVIEGDGFGVLDLAFVINKVLFIIALWNDQKGSWKITLVVFLLFCMNAFALMDKGSIFFMLSIIMFIQYEKGKIKLYHMGVAMGAIVLLFFILTILRSGTDSSGNNVLDDMTFLDFIGMYILANPVAFGYLNESITSQVGSNTFYLAYYYLNDLGLGQYEVVDIIQEFVSVPMITNLYTIVQPFFIDFGYLGIIVFSVIYGVACGWIYNRYRNGSTMGKVFYTYFVYLLVLQFGQEQIFLAPVPFIRLMILFYLLTQTKYRFSLRKT